MIVSGAAKGTSCEALRHWLGVESIRDRQFDEEDAKEDAGRDAWML